MTFPSWDVSGIWPQTKGSHACIALLTILIVPIFVLYIEVHVIEKTWFKNMYTPNQTTNYAVNL